MAAKYCFWWRWAFLVCGANPVALAFSFLAVAIICAFFWALISFLLIWLSFPLVAASSSISTKFYSAWSSIPSKVFFAGALANAPIA